MNMNLLTLIPNLYDFLSSIKHKINYFEEHCSPNNIDLHSLKHFFQKSTFSKHRARQTGLEQLEADFWVNNPFNMYLHINMLSIKLLTGWKAKLKPLFIS
jgi:hypothetical protein